MTLGAEQYMKSKSNNHFIWSGIEVYVKEAFVNKQIDLKKQIREYTKLIPQFLLNNIDTIYVGKFDFLEGRHLQAAFQHGSIWVSNEMLNSDELMENLVHETAHSLEEQYQNLIYSDKSLEHEFLMKRKQLFLMLKDEIEDLNLSQFLEVEYDVAFDEYLYTDIGYPMLSMYTVNLFYSPYAVTSLREYYATGFEAFFNRKDVVRLRGISPELYKKMVDLSRQAQKENF